MNDTVSPKTIKAYARKYGIDPVIAVRQLTQESGLRRHAGSPAGAQGVAQFMPETAKQFGVNLGDSSVRDDLDGWGKYMRQALDANGGDYKAALSVYNSGKADGYKRFDETKNYVQKILSGVGDSANTPGAVPTTGASSTTFTMDGPGVTTTRDVSMDKFQAFKDFRQHKGTVLDFAQRLQDLDQQAKDGSTHIGGVVTHVQAADASGGSVSQDQVSPNGRTISGKGAWGGSQSVVDSTLKVAAQMGIGAGSTKRTPAGNAAVGGASGSDHLTTNEDAFARDYPTSGETGTHLAQRIAKHLRVKFVPDSYESGGIVKTKHGTFKVQILYGPGIDHADHVHVGAHRVS